MSVGKHEPPLAWISFDPVISASDFEMNVSVSVIYTK